MGEKAAGQRGGGGGGGTETLPPSSEESGNEEEGGRRKQIGDDTNPHLLKVVQRVKKPTTLFWLLFRHGDLVIRFCARATRQCG